MTRPRKFDYAAELDRIEAALAEVQSSVRARIRVDIEPLAQDIARLCDDLVALPAHGGRAFLPRLGDLVAALDDLRGQLERSSEKG